ncbi:glycosyltransferase family 2 protein [Algoriphagus litoralis]|uniref:glycosyltransferase family 2 protein n=1 Tax=Algoriphagus litoralis TaxID=2202829 RepID=UPI000DBAC1C3|nr:glycosyltransferase family 2 protein [Algoriphagus litoralis]
MDKPTPNPNLTVSAILPIYNAEMTLTRAVESLLLQPEITQIILVEDGSRDKSLEICKKLESQHAQITLLQHPNGQNKGAPASRNLGLEHVRNPWIQFMDADDQLLPGKIEDQLNSITGEESFVVGEFIRRSKQDHVFIPFRDIWAGLIATRLGNTVSNLWSTQWVRAAGAWNVTLPNVQEYHLMFELLKLNPKVSFSSKRLTLVFPQPNSITNSENNQRNKRETYFSFRESVRKYLISKGLYSFKRRHYYNVCTGEMLRYHQPTFLVPFSSTYYFFYSKFKSFNRR